MSILSIHVRACGAAVVGIVGRHNYGRMWSTANLSATIMSLPLPERAGERVQTVHGTDTRPCVDVLVLFPAAVSVQRSQPNVARGSDRAGEFVVRASRLHAAIGAAQCRCSRDGCTTNTAAETAAPETLQPRRPHHKHLRPQWPHRKHLRPRWPHHKQGARPRIAAGDLARPGSGLLRWDLSSLPRNLVAEDMPMQSHGHGTRRC